MILVILEPFGGTYIDSLYVFLFIFFTVDMCVYIYIYIYIDKYLFYCGYINLQLFLWDVLCWSYYVMTKS